MTEPLESVSTGPSSRTTLHSSDFDQATVQMQATAMAGMHGYKTRRIRSLNFHHLSSWANTFTVSSFTAGCLMNSLSAQLKSARPRVMGILNVTPDSFSDGGRFNTVDAAVAHAVAMASAGADWIDIGGESTRPGSHPVSAAEQIDRVVPVIRQIRRELSSPLSVDTTRAEVAEAALDAGADLVNDISAGRDDPAMLPLIAARGVPVILMHMQGNPQSMQENPAYSDVVREVRDFLLQRLTYARTIGIDPADVLLDPGIGFGKSTDHNLQLLGALDELTSLGCPLVVGTSRKRFIGTVTGETGDRAFGTAATVAWAVAKGAAVVRVHDVPAMICVTRMIRALMQNAHRLA
jgi:dihydropteroate synthase